VLQGVISLEKNYDFFKYSKSVKSHTEDRDMGLGHSNKGFKSQDFLLKKMSHDKSI